MKSLYIIMFACLFLGCGGGSFSAGTVIDNQDGDVKPDVEVDAGNDANNDIGNDVVDAASESNDATTDPVQEAQQCVTEKDCPASPECGTAVCNAGYVCGVVPSPSGSPCNNGAGTCNGALKCFMCTPGTKLCDNDVPKSCNNDGQWEVSPACSGALPICSAGQCIAIAANCAGMTELCNGKSCCEANVIPGGTFLRSYDGVQNNDQVNKLATISSFEIDTYEVTVSRFRMFISAYPYNKPAAGAGKNVNTLGDMGWNSNWDAFLPTSKDQLKNLVKCTGYPMWTDDVGDNENKPMNCVSWYEAFAFCAWDGGRLATEAEWNYVAAGGNEQRVYPWSKPANSGTIDASYAAFNCQGDGSQAGFCAATDILNVGSDSPKGDSKWGQSDMSGNVWEWVLDFKGTYPFPCTDCANFIETQEGRVIRGGSYWQDTSAPLRNAYRFSENPIYRANDLGIRCARNN